MTEEIFAQVPVPDNPLCSTTFGVLEVFVTPIRDIMMDSLRSEMTKRQQQALGILAKSYPSCPIS